ncbi:hypothetical protein [Nocardiopsis coralliicola]
MGPAETHTVVLELDPATYGELAAAAGDRTVTTYLYGLAGRYARWNEMRDWLVHLEDCYGPLPADALERLHRRMLGLRPVAERSRGLSVAFTEEEFAALDEAADGRTLAAFVRDTVLDRITSGEKERTADPAGADGAARAADSAGAARSPGASRVG